MRDNFKLLTRVYFGRSHSRYLIVSLRMSVKGLLSIETACARFSLGFAPLFQILPCEA